MALKKPSKKELAAMEAAEKEQAKADKAARKKGSSLMARLKKASGSETASILADDEFPIRDMISCGNYLLNALIAGNYKCSVPSGRSIQLAGDKGVGKTYIATEICKEAQKIDYGVVIFDSEFANNDKRKAEERGLDTSNVLWVGIDTIEDAKTQMLKMLEEIDPEERIIFLMDSIGNLPSKKELEDSKAGVEKRDMTRAQALKALFRTVTMQCGYKNVPLIVINHVYANTGSMFGGNVIAGGGGPAYGTSIIIEFSKAQDKDGNDVIGAIITCKSRKNRMAKENQSVKIFLNYNTGIGKYSGLLEFFIEEGIIIPTAKPNKNGSLPKTCKFKYKGAEMTRKDFSPEFWEKELADEMGEYLSNKFRYMSAAEEILDDDFDDNGELDEFESDPQLLEED